MPRRAPLRVHVASSAGGFACGVDIWTRLRRVPILRSEGGSYHASEWTPAREHAGAVGACVRDVDPLPALREDRRASGVEARPVVVGMTSNGFSIADPNTQGMLDVVGFDTATPQLVSDFARGAL